jgi:hypothetical protein
MGELSADALPGRVVPGNQTGNFAIALCQAKRQAGDPSYYVLAHQANCSLPTITRAFSGAVLPRWRTVEGILKALRVPREQIDPDWRDLWVLALNERQPLPRPRSSGLTEEAPNGPQATVSPPLHQPGCLRRGNPSSPPRAYAKTAAP